MNKLALYKKAETSSTIISNRFIDDYMAEANGEFVKVYLYLLRCLTDNKPLSIADIADKFNHTETDIVRALKYWEKMGLLSLKGNVGNSITDICFLDILSKNTKEETTEESHFAKNEGNAVVDVNAAKEENSSIRSIPAYSANQLKQFKDNAEVSQMLFVAESYLSKVLSVTETNAILFFYDELKFSTDLIEYLIEYCVSKGSKSIHYIQKTALAWADDGIKTVQQAKNSTNLYIKNCYTVLNAFGIKGRKPVEYEVNYIKKWVQEYSFTLEIIHEACNRTMKNTHQPNFEYADKILKDWYQNKVHHLSDIKLLDEQFQKTKTVPASDRAKAPATKNKFNNFTQRNYDMNKLEKQLLNIE